MDDDAAKMRVDLVDPVHEPNRRQSEKEASQGSDCTCHAHAGVQHVRVSAERKTAHSGIKARGTLLWLVGREHSRMMSGGIYARSAPTDNLRRMRVLANTQVYE